MADQTHVEFIEESTKAGVVFDGDPVRAMLMHLAEALDTLEASLKKPDPVPSTPATKPIGASKDS